MGEQTTKTRAGWIDIAKVLGLVIVLMNHAELSAGGVNYFGGMFYVPVFFVLAGYTFRLRPGESFSAFAKKKAKRLLLPYVGYNAFFFLFFFVKDQLLGGQPLREAGVSLLGILYSRSYLYAGETAGQTVLMRILNGPTWFLTGLFTALLVFWLLMTWAKGSRKKLLAGMAVCLCAAWGFSFLPVLLPWSLDTLWFHMVLLGAGVLLRETDLIEKLYGCPWKIVLCGLIFFLVSALSGSGKPVGEKLWKSHAVLSGGGFAGFGAGHVAGKMDRKHLPAGRSAHCVRGKSYHGGALPASVCIYAHFLRLWGAGHRRQPESVEAMGDPGRFCTPGAFLSVAAPAPGKRGLAENSLWPAASGTGALVTAVGGKGHRRPGYWLVPDQIPVYF